MPFYRGIYLRYSLILSLGLSIGCYRIGAILSLRLYGSSALGHLLSIYLGISISRLLALVELGIGFSCLLWSSFGVGLSFLMFL